MPTATKTQPRNKPETPFLKPSWPWNFSVLGGIPTRSRCQSVLADDEASTGTELVAFYRVQEEISRANDIESRTVKLNNSYRIKTMSGVEQENLRREITRADHEKYLAAEAKLADLRREAFELVQSIVKRLVKSLNDELNDAALDAEQRLDKAGLPVRAGASWMLHDDAVCRALWSCRGKAEALLASLSLENAIATVQYFLTTEENTPFSWA